MVVVSKKADFKKSRSIQLRCCTQDLSAVSHEAELHNVAGAAMRLDANGA